MKTRLLLFAVLATTVSALTAADWDKGYVVHEWGTFTSVQGTDGVQMIWNPFVAPELPKFVYDVNHPGPNKAQISGVRVAGKIGTAQRQRMETPVIYFYSDTARTVDVSIKFPEGRVTEWYPQQIAPDLSFYPGMAATHPVLHWDKLEILPPLESVNAVLPSDPSGSHYYAARETDASVIRVPAADKKTEVEKFLFYRGVAGFQAPLTVKPGVNDSRSVTLTNTGAEELRHLFVYDVREDGGAWLPLEKLAPGETRAVSLETDRSVHQVSSTYVPLEKSIRFNSLPLNASLYWALVDQGLYPREAAAMIKTWESTWFAEKGMRVLYVLPRTWTDRTLPLTLTPEPRETQRVMVARAEIITAGMESKLLSQVDRYISADPATRPQIVAETVALGLGRFTESALSSALRAGSRGHDFSDSAWALFLATTTAPKTQGKPTAVE